MSRLGYLMATYFMTLFTIVFSLFHHTPRWMWNGSASVPIGLYVLYSPHPIRVGDLVADRPPIVLAHYMALRHYLPEGVTLLKHVGALKGQVVCRHGAVVSIDGRAAATALATDHDHRPLPVWHGCHILNPNEIFLLNPASAQSFDGRYFGIVPLDSVAARAQVLWTEQVR